MYYDPPNIATHTLISEKHHSSVLCVGYFSRPNILALQAVNTLQAIDNILILYRLLIIY